MIPIHRRECSFAAIGKLSSQTHLFNLLAVGLKAEILAEEWHHVILKTVSHCARVRTGINLEAVRDSILVQNIVELAGIDSQTVLVAHVNGNGAVLRRLPMY